MQITSLMPEHGYYTPKETVTFLVEIKSIPNSAIALVVSIHHLDDLIQVIQKTILAEGETLQTSIEWHPPESAAGYSVQAELRDGNGQVLSHAFTAVDVLPDWTFFPRYGFLTDFSAGRANPEISMQNLARFHINGVQFYDWQYRHDSLLATTDAYIDPLGRAMSLQAVRSLVSAGARRGIASMPYLAVYAASASFWRAHLEAALFDKEARPIPFGEDFLGLMNPAADSPWQTHLLDECDRALAAIPFAGLHIDQYGEPRQAWNSRNEEVDIPLAFASFIANARERHPELAIVFNAVGNWPIQTLAAAPLDFMYIEIWPPDVRYSDVAHIVLDAVRLSAGKPVIIALYIPADQPENVMQANAVIATCGGTRIELGEDIRLLTDPYFPKHQPLSPELRDDLQRHYDFLVCNGEWMQSYTLNPTDRASWAQADFQPGYVKINGHIWCVARRYPHGLALNLVNFSGLEAGLAWDKPHTAPEDAENVIVQIDLSFTPLKILWSTPEFPGTGAMPLQYDLVDGHIRLVIPSIHKSGVVFIHE